MTIKTFQDVELEVKRVNLEVDRLLTDVRLILDRINHITGISGSFSASPTLATDHGGLSGLGDDDHLQYILVSGTRPFTGDQSHGDFNITNVGDISLDSITSDDTTITIGGTSNSIVLTDDTTIAVTLGNDAGDNFSIDTSAFVVKGDTGQIGIGTATIPHGGVGAALLALDGPNASVSGPHVQLTTASDSYPLFQILPWRHDDISLSFDAYYDGAERSGDATSNFQIRKQGDKLRFRYDSGIAQGSVVTWNDSMIMTISGQIAMGSSLPSAPDGIVHIHSASAGTVSASTGADEAVLEGGGNTGMHILNPDVFTGSIYFGSPGDSIGAQVAWKYGAAGADQLMTIGSLSTSGEVSIVSGLNVEAIRIDSAQLVGIGKIPTVELDVLGTITGTTVTGANVTSGEDPGHTHTGASLGTIDISDDTNLVGGSGITLNDDTLDLDINSLAVAAIAAGDFVPFWDITATATNKKITFANFESTLNHDNLSGLVANEHIDHGSVTLTAGVGLSGGGDITVNRTFTVDLNELTTETAIAAGDFIVMVDITDSGSGKITFANFESTIDHGLIAGLTGDDHTQYILVAGTRAFTGNQSFGDFNITNVGSISLDSIISDGTTITIGGTPSIVLTNGTTIAVTLGNDPGDDFAIDTTVFVVEGDTGRVGIKTATPNNDFQVAGEVTITPVSGVALTISGVNNSHIINVGTTITASTNPQALRLAPTFEPTGTVGSFHGINVNPSIGGASANGITSVYVNNARLQFSDSYSGTITNLFSFYVSNPIDGSSATPVITNHYGLYIADLAYATNAWGIYQIGTQDNYLGGQLGVGIATPDGTGHFHTATAGAVTAVGSANELVLENSGDCGLSILAPDASTSALVFGSPSDASGAWVSWNFNSKLLTIGPTTASGEIRINTGAGVQAVYIDSSQNLGIRTSTAFGSGAGVLGIANAATNPTTNPTGGGILYSDGGAGKWRSSGGTTTTFGNAEPHCKVCGRDFVLEWENKKTGHLIVCMWCLTENLGQNDWLIRRKS